MPALCLANAVILNLNKWIYFKLRINAFVKVGFGLNYEIDKKSFNNQHDESSSCKERKQQELPIDHVSIASDESAMLDHLQRQNEIMQKK